MRFAPLLSALTVAVSGVSASLTVQGATGHDLTYGNKCGAPIPPWQPGCKPGWYNGVNPSKYPEYPCVRTGEWICEILRFFPKCLQCPSTLPTPPPNPPPTTMDGYTQTFSNLTGATQDGSYLTYGLVDTVADCLSMCNTVEGCVFVNTYHDVNGKGGSTELTCSLFSVCQSSATADNYGGQTQADGTVDYITNSDGWCKGTLPA